MHPMASVLYIGSGPNLIRKSSIPPILTYRIRAMKHPGLTAATNQSVSVDGVILLHVLLGELPVKVFFSVVTHLGVPLLLGTSFIDRFVRGIYPQVRKVVSFHPTQTPSSINWKIQRTL